MISLISSLSLKLYLNSLMYDQNIFGSSSKIFGNLRKSLENVRERSSGLRNIFGKSSESGRKSSEKVKSLFFLKYVKLLRSFSCRPFLKLMFAFTIIAHFGMSIFHDDHAAMRSFPGWINNIAKACFPDTLEWPFILYHYIICEK